MGRRPIQQRQLTGRRRQQVGQARHADSELNDRVRYLIVLGDSCDRLSLCQPAVQAKPACTAVHAVLPAGARGGLIEIDFVALRPRRVRKQ